MHFSDAIKADKAGEIMGYAKNTVIAYIQQKRIFAVRIGGKCIVTKRALAGFLVGDLDFESVHKSTWYMKNILQFVEKNTPNHTNEDDF